MGGADMSLEFLTAADLNFVVPLGKFAMSGPFVEYAVDCTIGLLCAFRLYGSEFRASNRVLIIEESSPCGLDEPPVATFAGITNPQLVAAIGKGRSESDFSLGIVTGGRIAKYRLCWGSDPLVPQQFNIDAGPFYMREAPSHCAAQDPLSLACSFP